MKHSVEGELRDMCTDIVERDQSVNEWRQTEPPEFFQGDYYHGAFDAEEDAFCFTYHDADGADLVFQFSLEEAAEIASGEQKTVEARESEGD